MHYYKFNIADYRKDTAHLTLLEHGIYRQLIDQYYLDERHLKLDLKMLMREVGVRSDEEKEAFEYVITKFFTKIDDGYLHSKCEFELSAVYSKSEKARLSAKKRWDNKQKNANALDINANACETHSERNANGMLPNNPTTQLPNKRAKKAVFSKPTLDEINAYILLKNYNINGEIFFNHYETNGWMVGKSPMKNWKSAISNWNARNKIDEKNKRANQPFDAAQSVLDSVREDFNESFRENGGYISE